VKNNVYCRLASCYLLLIMTVFLLFPGVEGYVHITRDKWVLFLVLSGLYAAANLLCAPVLRIVRGEPAALRRIRFSWTERMALLYLVLTVVSAVLSPHFPDTLLGSARCEGAVSTVAYVIVFLLLARHLHLQRWMIYVLGVSTALFCALCFMQLGGGNPLGLYPGSYTYFDGNVKYSGEFLGTIGNVDLVAAFLCIVMPLMLVYLIRGTERSRFALIVPLAMSGAVLVMMDVSAGYVGLAAGLICAAVIFFAKHRLRAAAVVALCLVICAAALYFTEPGGILGEVHEIMHGNLSPTFGSGRVHIWSQVLERVPDRLLFGHGPDTMGATGLESFSRYDEAKGKMVYASIDIAHNEYLNILFHQGILALCAFLAMLVTLIVRAARHRNNTAVVMCAAAILCWCVQAFFGFSLTITAPFFWCTAAALESTLRASPHCSDAAC